MSFVSLLKVHLHMDNNNNNDKNSNNNNKAEEPDFSQLRGKGTEPSKMIPSLRLVLPGCIYGSVIICN